LNQTGYRFTARGLDQELHLYNPKYDPVELVDQAAVRATRKLLPQAPAHVGQGVYDVEPDSAVSVTGLKPGKYELTIDGHPAPTMNFERYFGHPGPIRGSFVHDADEWMRGKNTPFGFMAILDGPSLDQAEKLRQTIIAKNELYFHRWRPANVTYLFGFRKYEQGQNAREIPQFDPLIAEKEKEIAELRKPREHVYQLVPAKDGK
jgi:hypothetical protein